MYFKLVTGRIMTEREMQTAYEIVCGTKAKPNAHYNDWVNSVYGIEKVIPESEITIEQLVKGYAFVEAVKLYKKQHGCKLTEAYDACNEIRNRKE